MASNDDRILKLAQKIYMVQFGEENDVSGSEQADFVNKMINWVNQFTPELETETDWNWSRTNDDIVATVSSKQKSYTLDDIVRTLVINPHRDLTIRQDGTVISTFKLVSANQVNDPTDNDLRDRATVIGRKLVLSREPTDQELGGNLVADSIAYLPELSANDVSLLDIVDPLQLIVLGVAKNQTLSEIVRRSLAPAFTQKYNALLRKSIEANALTAGALEADRESLSFVSGLW
jgi:hypothetical protein